jgi:hypothetical protein
MIESMVDYKILLHQEVLFTSNVLKSIMILKYIFPSFSHNGGTQKKLSHAKDCMSQNSNMNYFFFSYWILNSRFPMSCNKKIYILKK